MESELLVFRTASYLHEEPKYIVFKSKLWELFQSCPVCCLPCSVRENYTRGTMIQVEQNCPNCKFNKVWNSQPQIKNIAIGNILLSAAITFSGLSPTKCLRLLGSMGLATISATTLKVHNNLYIHPTVWTVWQQEQDAVITQLQALGGGLVCAGDGRADSPGHCAKFGTYTFLETRANKILTMELVQVILKSLLKH